MVAVEALPADKRTAAFEGFFRREYPRLLRLMYGLAGDPAEAEDLAQEAMARAFERWERIASMEAPEGYVYQIGLNLHRQRRRRILRRLQLPLSPSLESTLEPTDVTRALAGLSRTLREAFLLVDWLGYTSEEAARILSIAAGSVRARLHRARTQLRVELEVEDD